MNLQPIPGAPGKYMLLLNNGVPLQGNSLYIVPEVVKPHGPTTVGTSSPTSAESFQIDIATSDAASQLEVISASAASVTKYPPVQDISTLVFFDLETTGLPRGSGAPKVQITELSMVAVGKEDFEMSQFSDLRDVRVINKMCVCVRPTVRVSPVAARITGLNDYNLQGHQVFDKDIALMIQLFIAKLPKPICLLAHNGNTFDFPLLKAELENVGVQLPADILTSDTLVAFRSTASCFPPDNSQFPNKRQKSGGKSVKQSYALQGLYRKFFNQEPLSSHSAEGDCVALMMVCHKMKHSILPWICQNTRQFVSFKSMWG